MSVRIRNVRHLFLSESLILGRCPLVLPRRWTIMRLLRGWWWDVGREVH